MMARIVRSPEEHAAFIADYTARSRAHSNLPPTVEDGLTSDLITEVLLTPTDLAS